MKLVVIAVIGWLLVMASVFMVGSVLDSARRMISAPAGVRAHDRAAKKPEPAPRAGSIVRH